MNKAGFHVLDAGRYPNLTQDFRPQIEEFKAAQADIVTGCPIPPDMTRFWRQAVQLGFAPKVATVAKAVLFPAEVEALGELGDGLTAEVWWSPEHPFSSSLTGQSAKQLADSYTRSTGRQWVQPIGFVHALFEVAIDVLRRTSDIGERRAVRDAIASTNLETVVGPVEWTGPPVPNVAKTPVVGGQWNRRPGRFRYDLAIVTNKAMPQIELTGRLRPMPKR